MFRHISGVSALFRLCAALMSPAPLRQPPGTFAALRPQLSLTLTALLLSVCGPKCADAKEDGHSGNAKRLECVQLAGAIVKCGRSESGSKLHALQTLRAQERPHAATIRHRTYVPGY